MGRYWDAVSEVQRDHSQHPGDFSHSTPGSTVRFDLRTQSSEGSEGLAPARAPQLETRQSSPPRRKGSAQARLAVPLDGEEVPYGSFPPFTRVKSPTTPSQGLASDWLDKSRDPTLERLDRAIERASQESKRRSPTRNRNNVTRIHGKS